MADAEPHKSETRRFTGLRRVHKAGAEAADALRRARELATEYGWEEVLGDLAGAAVAVNRAAVKVQG